jgi:methyltransferase family protein
MSALPQRNTLQDPPAVQAFDAIASHFDERFGTWLSVGAQRRGVRRELLRAFPAGSSLLELGGGTGEDGLFLAAQGRRVLVTDGSAAMVAQIERKARAAGLNGRVRAARVLLEELETFAALSQPFEGAFSNFAALNCLQDLAPVARGLASVLPEGARALLVFFGPCPPGEIVLQLAKGDAGAAFRRFRRRAVPARLAGSTFSVWYPSPLRIARMFVPYFRLERSRGIGVFVPPSAAEPAISRFPRVLAALEGLDRVVGARLAWLGDHVLLEFRRTAAPLPA